MDILYTRLHTYIIKFSHSDDEMLNIVNDCLNSKLLMCHFDNWNDANDYAVLLESAENEYTIERIIQDMENKYGIIAK